MSEMCLEYMRLNGIIPRYPSLQQQHDDVIRSNTSRQFLFDFLLLTVRQSCCQNYYNSWSKQFDKKAASPPHTDSLIVFARLRNNVTLT